MFNFFWLKLVVLSYFRTSQKYLMGIFFVRWILSNRLANNKLISRSRQLELLVFKRRRVCFVLNPKVGSRSVIDFFKRNEKVIVLYDDGSIAKHLIDVRDYKLYAFFRDPISRAVSCYKQKFLNKDPRITLTHNALGVESEQMTFQQYCEFLLSDKGSDDVADKHWKSQSELLSFSSKINLSDYEEIINFNYFSNYLTSFLNSKNTSLNVPKTILSTSSIGLDVDVHCMLMLKERYKQDIEFYANLKVPRGE